MTNLPAATVAAVDFYDKHYAGAKPIFLEPGMKLMLGSAERPRHCRFCGKDEPAVTFKDEAHALPAAFGNTGLFIDPGQRAHRLGPVTEMVFGALTEQMIAGIAFVVASG